MCVCACVCECVLVLVLVLVRNSHKKEKKNNDWKSVADRHHYLFLLIKESETRPLGLSKKRTETFFSLSFLLLVTFPAEPVQQGSVAGGEFTGSTRFNEDVNFNDE